MAQYDWHQDRTDNHQLRNLDNISNTQIDATSQRQIRAYRLARVREQMEHYKIDALILSDSINIRYTTGARNMQVFTMRNAPSRYLLLTQTKSILYEFTGCEHLAADLETIDEVRPAQTVSFVACAHSVTEREISWAKQMAKLIKQLCAPQQKIKIGLERLNANVAIGLAAHGFTICDGQMPVEMARAIKSKQELLCINQSLRATEYAVGQLKKAIAPGISENELWSILHQHIIAQDGDYVETRLLSAGKRTNPWFQESSNHLINANELIALDTDVVGCHGYYSDFSRTFHAGPNEPDAEQKELYRLAREQIDHNMSIIKPGLSFYEYAQKAWNIPKLYHANRYYLSAHGCGMSGEYPYLYHIADYQDAGYNGILEPNMTICVESYIGKQHGSQGVKLEQQILITNDGIELLSQFPFEQSFLA